MTIKLTFATPQGETKGDATATHCNTLQHAATHCNTRVSNKADFWRCSREDKGRGGLCFKYVAWSDISISIYIKATYLYLYIYTYIYIHLHILGFFFWGKSHTPYQMTILKTNPCIEWPHSKISIYQMTIKKYSNIPNDSKIVSR